MSTSVSLPIRRAICSLNLMVCMCFVLAIGRTQAQTPDEHASHHPGGAPAGGMSANAGAPGGGGVGGGAMGGPPAGMGGGPPAGVGGGPPAGMGGGPPAGAGGMMGSGGMGGMMEKMGAPKPRDMYPSLMALPELTPEKRREVEQQASDRMHTGTVLMGQALDALNAGTQSGDYAAMHEATMRMREGIAQLESGVAAKRALAEGRAPREVALAWFKQEMSLVSPVVGEAPKSGRGLSILHLFTMVLLVVFAFAMLAMYFFKMRRAAALFGRIEPDEKSPPPGSTPPLVGEGGSTGQKSPLPAKPATDNAPAPAAGEKPASATSTDKPAEPPAEKPAARTPPPEAS